MCWWWLLLLFINYRATLKLIYYARAVVVVVVIAAGKLNVDADCNFFSIYFWLAFANFRRVHFLLKLHAIEHFVLVNCACCMRRMRYMCEQLPRIHCPYAQLCRKTQNSLAQQANILPVPGTVTVTEPAPYPLSLCIKCWNFSSICFFRADKNVGYFSCCCCCCCSRENCAICLQVEGCFSCAHKCCVFVLRQPSSKSNISLCVLTHLKRE